MYIMRISRQFLYQQIASALFVYFIVILLLNIKAMKIVLHVNALDFYLKKCRSQSKFVRMEGSVNHNFFTKTSVMPKLTKDTLNAKNSCLFLLIVDLFTDTNFVLAGYKTEQCTKPPRLCRQGYACPHYHNSRDRRRNPRKFKYRYINAY